MAGKPHFLAFVSGLLHHRGLVYCQEFGFPYAVEVHGALQICMVRYHALISAPVPPGEGMFTAQMR